MVTSAFRRSRSSVWRYASRMSWDTGWKAVWATSKSKSSKPKSVRVGHENDFGNVHGLLHPQLDGLLNRGSHLLFRTHPGQFLLARGDDLLHLLNDLCQHFRLVQVGGALETGAGHGSGHAPDHFQGGLRDHLVRLRREYDGFLDGCRRAVLGAAGPRGQGDLSGRTCHPHFAPVPARLNRGAARTKG